MTRKFNLFPKLITKINNANRKYHKRPRLKLPINLLQHSEKCRKRRVMECIGIGSLIFHDTTLSAQAIEIYQFVLLIDFNSSTGLKKDLSLVALPLPMLLCILW